MRSPSERPIHVQEIAYRPSGVLQRLEIHGTSLVQALHLPRLRVSGYFLPGRVLGGTDRGLLYSGDPYEDDVAGVVFGLRYRGLWTECGGRIYRTFVHQQRAAADPDDDSSAARIREADGVGAEPAGQLDILVCPRGTTVVGGGAGRDSDAAGRLGAGLEKRTPGCKEGEQGF